MNRRTTIGFFPWRFVDAESSIGRCAAFVEDAEFDHLMELKESLGISRFGDAFNPAHAERIDMLSR